MSSDALRGEQFLRDVVVSSAHGVFVCSLDGAVVYCNDVLTERTGYDWRSVVRVSDVCRVQGGDPLSELKARATGVPVGESVSVEGRLVADEGETDPVTLVVEAAEHEAERYLVVRVFDRAEPGEFGAPAFDAPADSGGDDPRRGVESAVETARAIARAESVERASERLLDWSTGRYDADLGCVRLYDRDRNAFATVAETEEARRLRETRPVCNLDETRAGRAFRQSEPVVEEFDPGGSSDRALRSLHVPIGDRGVLSVFPPAGFPLVGDRLSVVTALGSVFAAELVGSSAETRSDSPLEVRRARLDTVREVAAVCDAADVAARRLFEAGDVTEMKQSLCDALESNAPFDTVQVVETDPADDWRVADATGTKRSRLAPDLSAPAVRAALEDVVDSGAGTTTVRHDRGPGGESAVTVAPVRPGKRGESVLVASREPTVGEDAPVEARLETLGYLTGFALQTARDERLLLSERRIELEFEVTGESCLAVPVSSELGCYCEVEHATLTCDGDYLLFVRADHPDPQAVAEAAAAAETVTDCRVVGRDDGESVVEVRKPESGAQAMLSVGATILEASAEDGVGSLVVELPPAADVAEVVDEYVSRSPTARLVAQRTVEESIETPTLAGDVLESELTDKQRSALTTAYHAGYFDWPRKSTAEEIASSLSVSSPTFQQHLRRALCKILDAHV